MRYVALFTAASACALAIGIEGCSDNDGGQAGSGGSAGSAASGGSGGSGASGGSGGSAGSAGTGGGAGTSGTGGAGSGGTAGTGSGGAGGSGGTSGDRCSTCLGQKCASQVDACEANADCSAIYDCVIADSCGEIPEPQVCIDDCSAEHQAGTATFAPVTNCILDTCGQECSGS